MIAGRLEPVIQHEYRGLEESEVLAAVDAVTLTLETAAPTEADLFKQDLDAGFLDRHLRRQGPIPVRYQTSLS